MADKYSFNTDQRKMLADQNNSMWSTVLYGIGTGDGEIVTVSLSQVGNMQDRYSSFNPAPRLPSDMLRSVLVSVAFKITSYTKWAADLKENYLHAILSGFTVGDTPGVGTFYDFFSRLWLSDKKNLTNPVHPPKEKPQKPKGKEEKAPPVEKITVKDLFTQFEQDAPQEMNPCKRLYEIFKVLFLQHSVNDGLINLKSLNLKSLAPAGDGTPVYTAAQERKKRTCNCLEQGIRDCKCDRIYRQPDCNIGWDSHRNRYYFGYDLYMLTAPDSINDLPVFPILNPTSRHDSHGFLYNWYSMKQLLPEASVTKLLLDSAHDAMPYYEYCKEHHIVPFIDLNGKGGHPTCICEHPCSDAKYGRTVPLVLKDNSRLFNYPPRSSEEWKLEYNVRTSAERCNKREKLIINHS